MRSMRRCQTGGTLVSDNATALSISSDTGGADGHQRSLRLSDPVPFGEELCRCRSSGTCVRICCCLMGGRSSARQWSDIFGIIKQQGAAHDVLYLAQWVDVLGVRDLLERALVCSAPSRERLNEMLRRANDGLESSAVTAIQFLQERLIHPSLGTQSTSSWERQEKQENTSVAVATHALLAEGGLAVMPPDEARGNALEQRRRAMEEGVGGDHDVSYAFALPWSLPHVLA